MKVYIAGPMRGIPLFNFPAFDAAEERIRAAGHEPLNPAALDRAAGFNEHESLSGEVLQGMMREFLRRDLAAVCDCDAIALLPGWLTSRGARLEAHLACVLEIPAYSVEELCDSPS